MQWTEDMSAGIPMLDDAHRELFNRLNRLRAAIKKQVCRYTIDDMLVYLAEYVEVHFCKEEQHMKYYSYPDYALHREKHRNFASEVHFLKEELRNIRALGLKGSYELSVETVQAVVDWSAGHIAGDDRKLGEFLRRNAYTNIDVVGSLCGGEERITGKILTICSICHKIRSNKGLWRNKEYFVEIPIEILYSHVICPECLEAHYSSLFAEKR